MTTTMYLRVLALALIAPATALLPIGTPPRTLGLSPAERAELHVHVAPSLGSLRAGRVDAPRSFDARERAELRAAQERSSSLAAMRGGAPTDSEWGWIAIGAGVVLLIVLL